MLFSVPFTLALCIAFMSLPKVKVPHSSTLSSQQKKKKTLDEEEEKRKEEGKKAAMISFDDVVMRSTACRHRQTELRNPFDDERLYIPSYPS